MYKIKAIHPASAHYGNRRILIGKKVLHLGKDFETVSLHTNGCEDLAGWSKGSLIIEDYEKERGESYIVGVKLERC